MIRASCPCLVVWPRDGVFYTHCHTKLLAARSGNEEALLAEINNYQVNSRQSHDLIYLQLPLIA